MSIKKNFLVFSCFPLHNHSLLVPLLLRKCGEKEVSDQDCVAIGSRLRGAMGTRRPAKFWPQLWATVVRNLLLKKRDTRKTLAVSTRIIISFIFIIIHRTISSTVGHRPLFSCANSCASLIIVLPAMAKYYLPYLVRIYKYELNNCNNPTKRDIQ